MDVYKTDDEQVEQIKKWLKENGPSLISGLLIGLAILFGSRAWIQYGERKAEQASNIYAQMTQAVANGNMDRAVAAETKLTNEYSGTPYASLSQLLMAGQKLKAGENVPAAAHLGWAHDHAEMDGIRQTARVRLLRVRIAEGKLNEAEALLNGSEIPPGYAFLFDELKGDIAAARGDHAAAKAAYERALEGLPDNRGRALLEAKRNDMLRPETVAGDS